LQLRALDPARMIEEKKKLIESSIMC